jgi:hypothetical protein
VPVKLAPYTVVGIYELINAALHGRRRSLQSKLFAPALLAEP